MDDELLLPPFPNDSTLYDDILRDDAEISAAFESFFFDNEDENAIIEQDPVPVAAAMPALFTSNTTTSTSTTHTTLNHKQPTMNNISHMVPDEVLSNPVTNSAAQGAAMNTMTLIQPQLDLITQALEGKSSNSKDLSSDSSLVTTDDAAFNRWKRRMYRRYNGNGVSRARYDVHRVNTSCNGMSQEQMQKVCQALVKDAKAVQVLPQVVDVVQLDLVQSKGQAIGRKQQVKNPNTSSVRRSNRHVVPSEKLRHAGTAATNPAQMRPDMVLSSSMPTAATNSTKFTMPPAPITSSSARKQKLGKNSVVRKATSTGGKTSLPQIYTAKQQQVELPSGNDIESKRQRRLIRNRLSAALHRERKREVSILCKNIGCM